MSGTKSVSLPTQMAIGLFLGVLCGVAAQKFGRDPQWFKPLGQLFINLVRMVVVPLVLVTLISGAASVGDVSRLGRVAGKTLVYYFVTTAVAIIIGLILANIVQPGLGLNLSMENLKAREVVPPALSQVLLNIVPINPVEALSKGNMLQIIFFAVLLGFSISYCGEKARTVISFFDGMSEVMIRVTTIVMIYAPVGVFGLMAFTVASHGLGVLLPLIKLVGVMYAACLLQILLVYFPLVRWSGLAPGSFMRGLSEPLLIAFTTCSSAAALSSNLLSVRKLGASRSVATFSIPLGKYHQYGRCSHLHGHHGHFRRGGLRNPHAAGHAGYSGSHGPACLHRLHGRARSGPDHDDHGFHPGGHSAGSHCPGGRHRPDHGHGAHHHQRPW